ncbi:MAG: penicillin-binding protein 1B [Gammaproteobacteria bacterium]|nr:penicillin-binding protein 1B [Gammaproteobacteria bacterium]
MTKKSNKNEGKKKNNKPLNKSSKNTENHKFSWRKLIVRTFILLVVALIGLVIYSDAEIEEKFATNRWLVPAKVYARPLSLLEGESINHRQLLMELKLLNYRISVKATQPGQYERYNNDYIIYLRGFQFPDHFEPARKVSLTLRQNVIEKIRLLSGDGTYSPFRLEPVFIDRINPLVSEDRELIAIDKVPHYLIDALIISEDREFFEHIGISAKGIARALGQNVSSGKITQGGSTLTQQLVKNYFLNNERTLWRKAREAVMALILEQRYSKPEILEAYINEVYLGQDGGRAIHGFAKASRFYFDQDLTQLNLAQTVTLVALVRGPSFYEPRRHPNRALERRDLILEQLAEFGKITSEQLAAAKKRSLQVVAKGQSVNSSMPAAISMVRRQLQQHYSLDQLNHDDLSVFTSIDPNIQIAAEQALAQRVSWFTKSYPSVPEDLQGALIVSDRLSGNILAIVGDKNPKYDGFNRAIDAYRQTGSAIKPFVYLAALQRAQRFSLQTELKDQSFSLTATDGSLWQPKNYDGEQHGEVRLEEALVHSYNLSTARLAMSVGIENIVELLYESGFKRELKAFPSLALGAQEMSPYELLKLYQVLASNGLRVESSIIHSVVDSNGKLLNRYAVTAHQAVSPESVYLVNRTLQKVVVEGTAKGLGQQLGNLALAGKTGTTDDLKDSWFAGFSQQYVAVAWLGLDDNQPMNLTGSSGAMQVWSDFMKSTEQKPLELVQPRGIVTAKSGWFGDCEPFVNGFVPEGFSICSN